MVLQDIFIVGSPRSGTTWLHRLLAEHPDLACPPELHLFSDFLVPCETQWNASVERNQVRHAAGANGNGLDELLDREAFLAWMRGLYTDARDAALVLRPGATRLLEKTPTNAQYLPLIREVVPGARFVHLVRNPADVVASLLEQSRRPFGDWAPSDVLTATELWLGNVSAARRDADHTDTLSIRYEDLNADVRGVLQCVTDFAGLPGGVDEWLHGDPRTRANDRGDVVVRRPGRRASGDDEQTGAQSSPLSSEPTTTELSELERWYVESRCFTEMAEFGYSPSVFTPDRPSRGRRVEAALRIRAPYLARRVAARAGRELHRSR